MLLTIPCCDVPGLKTKTQWPAVTRVRGEINHPVPECNVPSAAVISRSQILRQGDCVTLATLDRSAEEAADSMRMLLPAGLVARRFPNVSSPISRSSSPDKPLTESVLAGPRPLAERAFLPVVLPVLVRPDPLDGGDELIGVGDERFFRRMLRFTAVPADSVTCVSGCHTLVAAQASTLFCPLFRSGISADSPAALVSRAAPAYFLRFTP